MYNAGGIYVQYNESCCSGHGREYGLCVHMCTTGPLRGENAPPFLRWYQELLCGMGDGDGFLRHILGSLCVRNNNLSLFFSLGEEGQAKV